MKKITKLLGAFALGAMATFSATAAVNELPAYAGSCVPAVGTTVAPENSSQLGTVIYVYPASGQKFGVWVDGSGYDFGNTADNVIEITKPDNVTVSSVIQANQNAIYAAVPADTWGLEGIYTITVKANGIKLMSGATATDFSYQVGIGNDITIGGGGDDSSIPAGWTVSPAQDTEGTITTFGGKFSIEANYVLNTYDNDTYTYNFPGGGKDVIEVKFPDGVTSLYSVQAVRQYGVEFTIPNSEFQKHGTGTCTVTAKFAGLKADSGDDLKDFTWEYKIIEAPAVNLDDIQDLPADASIYTNIDDAFYDKPIATDHILKSIGNFYVKIPSTDYAIAKFDFTDASVTLYKKDANGYAEVGVAKNVKETTDDGITTYANRVIDFYFRPAITESGEYALVIDLPNTKYGSPSAAMPKLKFFVTIPSKPDPVDAEYGFTPVEGTQDVDNMPTEIKVTFTNAAHIEATSGMSGIATVTDPEGNSVTVSNIQLAGNGIVFSVPTGTWNKNGEYKLTLDPSGVVKATAENEADLIFAPISWSYNVIGNEEPLPDNITITPAPGNVGVSAFADGIKVAFAGDYFGTFGQTNVSITCNGEEYKNAAGQQDAFFQFNGIDITEPGKYVFEFKGNGAKWVKNTTYEQIAVPDFQFIYEVLAAPAAPSVTIPDVDTTTGSVELPAGTKITLTAGPGETIYYMWEAAAAPVVLKAPKDGYTEYTGPIDAQNGTLNYYAEGPGGESPVQTLNVTVQEGFQPVTLPEGVTVTPEQAEYTIDQVATVFADGIIITPTDLYATMNQGNITITCNGKEYRNEANQTDKFYKFSNIEITEPGRYVFNFALNGASPFNQSFSAMNIPDFQFVYQVLPAEVPESNIPEGVTVEPKEGVQAPNAFTGTISIAPKNAGNGAAMNANTATLTVNGTVYNATQGEYLMSSIPNFTFDVPADVFANDGIYTCVFNPGSCYKAMGDVEIPEEFQFVYKVDHTVGVAEIVIENGEAQFFTLEGIKVQNPEQGKIYIKIMDGKSSKVLIK